MLREDRFSRLLRHPDKIRMGSILTTPEPARGPSYTIVIQRSMHSISQKTQDSTDDWLLKELVRRRKSLANLALETKCYHRHYNDKPYSNNLLNLYAWLEAELFLLSYLLFSLCFVVGSSVGGMNINEPHARAHTRTCTNSCTLYSAVRYQRFCAAVLRTVKKYRGTR